MIGGADGTGNWGECDPAEPRNRRTRASIVIEQDGKRLLVDTTPDMRQQLLACRVAQVDAILFTHGHADHIMGLDDVRILNRICGHPLDAFATSATLGELQSRFGYAFRPWKPPGFFWPVMVPCEVAPGETVSMAGMPVRLFDQDHTFVRTLGLRVGGFGYSTDVVDLDEAAFAALAGVDTWVVDCFQRHAHRAHAWLARALSWAERLQPRRTILTHMGPDMDFAATTAKLPPGVEAGYDGMILEIAP
jgi:phosphoribosyl 1,2-cyclic phosphate phosphodiesterase